jgi:hypothetical protein
MDNASNCNKLAEILPEFLPDFPGMDARLRCLAHIFNLVAKVLIPLFSFFFRINLKYISQIFISFFFKKPKLKKSVKVTSEGSDEEEFVLDEGDGETEDDVAAVEEAVVEAEEGNGDDGQVAHDNAVVKSLRDIAIQEMSWKGVVMSLEEEKMALRLFPAVIFLSKIGLLLSDILLGFGAFTSGP